MGGHRTKGSTYREPVTTPAPDYHIDFDPGIIPDCSGNYFLDGLYNGEISCRRSDNQYFIWWNDVNTYKISTAKGVTLPGDWGDDNDIISGVYPRNGTYEGFPFVQVGAP